MESLFKQLSLNEGHIGWNELVNNKRPSTYEVELFVERYYEQLDREMHFEYFYLGDEDTVENSIDIDNDIFFKEVLSSKTGRKSIYTSELLPISYIGKKVEELHNIERFKKLKGFSKKVTVPLFIESENIAVLCDSFNNAEDILNLLNNPSLNVYVAQLYFRLGYVLTKVIPTKEMMTLLEKLRGELESVKNDANVYISNIRPRKEKTEYLSLHNKEECRDFYQSLTEKEKRTFNELLTNRTGQNLIGFIESSAKSMLKFADTIMTADIVLSSYVEIDRYLKDKEEQLAVDRERNSDDIFKYYYHKIRFTDYKMLVKELNKHYRELQKWASECYGIVTANEEIVHKTPNKDSLHYKAALEASEEISKLWFVSEVILFGSVAKGEEKPESDIDLMFKIGFDTSMLTEARNASLVSLVTGIVKKVERKYEKLMEAYPQKGVFPYSEKSMFNFLSISMSSKSDLKMFERTGFFDNAITLFKREQFEFRVNDLTEIIPYSDIECAIVPTRGTFTLFAKVIHDNEKYRYIQYYKYDFESQFSNVEPYYDDLDYKNYEAQAILVQKLDKSKSISYHFRANLDYHNMFIITSKRDYDKFLEEELNAMYPRYVNSIDEYDDIYWTYFVPMNHEIYTGGVRMVKKNTPHFFRVEEQRHS